MRSSGRLAKTANDGDDATADGVQGDHTGQQERKHDERCAPFARALNVGDHHRGDADEKRPGEEHPAGLGEPKPTTEPAPIASESSHA
jgi:hypothetical protein